MTLTLDQIVEETAQLPADVAAELIERILIRRHGGIEPGIESAWKIETRRRIEEIVTGQVEGVPMEEAFARAARSIRS